MRWVRRGRWRSFGWRANAGIATEIAVLPLEAAEDTFIPVVIMYVS